MKFVYFGSSHFSRAVLKALDSNGLRPCFVVSQPDRPKGRGLKTAQTLVSQWSEEKNIPLIKPAALKNEKVIDQIRGQNADIFLVADYGKILTSEILALPRLFPLCVHPSLLPQYRGPAPVHWTLIHGLTQTGVSLFKVVGRVDAGDILSQKKIAVKPEDNVITLTESLAFQGGLLFVEALKKIEGNDYKFTPQDENQATYYPKLTKESGKIDWKISCRQINDLIRGTIGWPNAYTFYKSKQLQVLAAEISQDTGQGEPGAVLGADNDKIRVACGQGVLRIVKVKPEGKNEMTAGAFARGARLKAGDKFV